MVPYNQRPGDGAVSATRTILAISLVLLQMWALQMGVEDWLAGRFTALSALAVFSILCFLLTSWLFLTSER